MAIACPFDAPEIDDPDDEDDEFDDEDDDSDEDEEDEEEEGGWQVGSAAAGGAAPLRYSH
jgi:hypothetical protein